MPHLVDEKLIGCDRLECRRLIDMYKSLHVTSLEHALELVKQNKMYVDVIAILLNKVAEAEAKVKLLNQKHFGDSSERKKNPPKHPIKGSKGRGRGQKSNGKGHGRTALPKDLPTVEEILTIPEKERTCSTCHQVFPEFGKPEVSEILEVEVKGYKRKIIRPKYKTCNCGGHSKIITAPPAKRLIPKSSLGVSVISKFISNKYVLSMPIERTCKELASFIGQKSPGTIIGALEYVSSYFDPLHDLIYEKLMTENYFNCDETFTKVFEKIEGKANYKWYIWGIFSKSVRYFRYGSNRSTENLTELFKGLDKSIKEIVILADRFSSYKCFANIQTLITVIVAFCWAHVRRDFLDGATAYPEHADWMFSWKKKIGELFAINNNRVICWNPELPLSEQKEDFQIIHKELGEKLLAMKKEMETELINEKLPVAKRKILESLQRHWVGLTHFYERPYIKMDNNLSERELRLCVLGRKNFYGAGSIWSAELSAKMYSFVKTFELWGLNATKGIYEYLLACSENGGKPPNLNEFLPWEMSEERKQFFREPMITNRPDMLKA